MNRNIAINYKIITELSNAFLNTNLELAGFLIYDKIIEHNKEKVFCAKNAIWNYGLEDSVGNAYIKGLDELKTHELPEENTIIFHAHSRKAGDYVKDIDVKLSTDDFRLPKGKIEQLPQYGLALFIKPKQELENKIMPNDTKQVDFVTLEWIDKSTIQMREPYYIKNGKIH